MKRNRIITWYFSKFQNTIIIQSASNKNYGTTPIGRKALLIAEK